MGDEFSDYYFVVEGHARKVMYDYLRAIQYFISYEEPVPYPLVQVFLRLLNDRNGLFNHRMDAEAMEIAKRCEDRLSKYPDYLFSYKDDTDRVVSFNEIMYLSSLGYLIKRNQEKDVTAEKTIQYFYEVIYNVFRPLLSLEDQGRIKKYKAAVITAVLTEECGMKVTTKSQPSNSDLYGAVKYAINKQSR